MSMLTIQEDILYNVYFEYKKYSNIPTFQGDKLNDASFIMYLIVKLYINNIELKPTFIGLLGDELFNYLQTSKNKEDILVSIGYQYQNIMTTTLSFVDRDKLGTDTFLNLNMFEIHFLLCSGHPLIIPNIKQQINEYVNHSNKRVKINKDGPINTERLMKVIKMIEKREQDSYYTTPKDDAIDNSLIKKIDFITELLVKQQQEINELKQMVKLIIL